jgi:asparagine synthase (glutamine-hydrolysing)
MGGILALAGPALGEAEVAAAGPALDLLAHRGSGRAEDRTRSAYLGNRHLPAARAPEDGTLVRSADGRYAVSADGEVFNGGDLRAELAAAGWAFATGSDAETMLAAYVHWGDDCAARFRGLFAFAVLDRETGRVFATRDRTGMKPIFFTERDGLFALASEPKAIHGLRLFPVEPDARNFNEFLIWGYVAGEQTLVEGLRELQPGWSLTYDGSAVRTARYGAPWDGIDALLDPADELGAADALEQVLFDTVGLWARDAEGAPSLMSGGLDSPFMSWLAGRVVPGLTTFSAVFPHAPDVDESAAINRVVPALGTAHVSIELDDSWVNGDIAGFLAPYDEPSLDSNYVTLDALCRGIRDRFPGDAVMCGEGSDEMFGGYERHRRVTGEYVESGDPEVAVYARNVVALPRLRLFSESVDVRNRYRFDLFDEIRSTTAGSDPLNAVLMLDQLTFLGAYNHRQDRVGMQYGLEIRMPYQDAEVARFANSLPASLKHRDDWRKWLLRRVAERHMPHDAVWKSAKQMFALPVSNLFEGRLDEIYRDVLSPGCKLSRWYDVGGMHRLLDDHRASDEGREHSNTLWRLLSLELWLRALPPSPA